MRIVRNIICILLAMHIVSVQAQTKSELRDNFFSAEVDILYEDYAEALPKYLNLLKTFPENYNFYFRTGQCYLNTPGEKEKSIPYLETASQHISMKYREGKFRETDAPYDVLYYLANAYRVNNNLDKALETYNQFMKDCDPDIYDTALVNFQIRECYVARNLMANPVYVVERNLGSPVNERFSESDPVVSSDENTLVFTRALQFYDAVFYTKKVNGVWTPPVNMTPQLGIDQDYFSSSLTGDGNTLLLYKTDNYEGNIYESRFADGKWSNVVKLNDNINTKYWESHATLSSDGKKLYFTSNRKESLGGLDIFVSERDSTGNWGTPVNLGPVINTPYNEESPFLANNDQTLFFSSRGHENMGGYDIFRSDLNENGQWGKPVNLGYPVNTTDDDLFFTPVGDGSKGYYAKFDPAGLGRMDVVTYEIFNERHPRNFFVTGKASINNLRGEFPEQIKVTAISNADASKVVSAVTDPHTGYYSLRLPQGSFNFNYTADGAKGFDKTVDMPLTYKGDTVSLDQVVLPNADFIADMHLMADTALKVTSGEPVLFNLRVEPRSILKVDLYSADSLLTSASLILKDTSIVYRLTPPEGNSKAVFSLTDRFGNNTSVKININRTDVTRISKPQYEKIIARKQVAALLDLLKKYASEDVKAVLNTIDPEEEELGTPDDLVSLVRTRSAGANIKPFVIDKLALEVALREGVLTQAAVDLMFNKSEGPVHEALAGLDIYKLKIRNWNDLVKYTESVSSGKVTGEDLRKLAEYILMEAEPGINILRDKVLRASSFVADSTAIREAVKAVDAADLKYQAEWVSALLSETGKMSVGETAKRILAAISYKPGTKVSGMVTNLELNSGPDLKTYLESIDLHGRKIKSPSALVSYLCDETGKGNVKGNEVFGSLAKIIINADLTDNEIKVNLTELGKNSWWWMIIAGLILVVFVIWLDRRNKKKKN